MIDQNYQYQDRNNDSGSGFGAKHLDKKIESGTEDSGGHGRTGTTVLPKDIAVTSEKELRLWKLER